MNMNGLPVIVGSRERCVSRKIVNIDFCCNSWKLMKQFCRLEQHNFTCKCGDSKLGLRWAEDDVALPDVLWLCPAVSGSTGSM